MVLEKTAFRVESLLNECLNMAKEVAEPKGLKLALQLDSVPPQILADERRLRQVLLNLLTNAVKFTDPGGRIRLTAKGMRAGGAAPVLELSVVDTGIGIAPQDLERVFTPFEKAGSAANRRFEGTGIGLSLARKLVELHGGRIWAESEGPGRGAAIRLILPI